MKVATLNAVQGEPTMFDNLRFTSSELRALVTRSNDATMKLEVARVLHDFPALRGAYLELETIRDQTSHMLEGIARAIEAETERRQK